MINHNINPKDFLLPQAIEVIRGNINKYGNPLALKGSEIASWAKGLNLPLGDKDYLFYTGGEYQLIPYIDSLVQTMTMMDQGSKAFSLMMGVRNLIDKTGISAEKLYASVLAKDRERYNKVSYKAASILQELGLSFCYLGEQEPYSGALLYELGFWDDLKIHAQKVTSLFNETGAKTIICLSPHSAEVFKLVYPKLVDNFDFEVRTFVDIISDLLASDKKLNISGFTGKIVIHDSCRLARELGITEEIRGVLNNLGGVTLVEAEQNRTWTTCCGGPCKIMFPDIAGKIANYRVDELEETGAEIVLTFCPYCMAALDKGIDSKKSSLKIEDFIEFLYRRIA